MALFKNCRKIYEGDRESAPSGSYMGDVETVHRRFTKRLPGFRTLPYAEQLKRLQLPSLELRRLHFDLIYCYKILFDIVHLQVSDFFEMASPLLTTRGHAYISCTRKVLPQFVVSFSVSVL